MRKDAAEAREKARKLLAYAEALEAAADLQEGLRSRDGYDTVDEMDATASSSPRVGRHPGPSANDGPMMRAAKLLGLDTLQGLADALGETHGYVRTANHRGAIPARAQKKLDALLKARAAK